MPTVATKRERITEDVEPGIVKFTDGRVKPYRARYRDVAGREHRRDFKLLRDARAFLGEVAAALSRGEYVEPARGRLTVGKWSEKWFAGRVDLKPKTVASYESLWATCVKPTWERVPLDAVRNADVAAWVAKLSAKPLSPSRVRQAFHLFSAMLGDAVKDRRLASNPALGVKLPRMPQVENRYLTHQQLDDLANACGPYSALARVLGYCGLRFGEAAALRVGRVDILRGRLDIAEAMTEINGKAVFGTPKTHQRRSVPVPAFLRKELARACANKGPNDFVFPSATGRVLRVNKFRSSGFDDAVAALGLGNFTPHDLRDAAASFAIASGASVKGVQSMLGHKTATMTLDRYAALWPDELDEVAQRVDAARIAERKKSSRTFRGPTVVPLRATEG